MKIDSVHSDSAPEAIGPYSQAVIVGEFIFTSGQIALDSDGAMVGDDVTAQAKQVFANLAAVLEAAGSSLNHVIKATVFLADMGDFPKLNEVYAAAFGDHKPARSTVEVARLPKDAKVEIDLVALTTDA